MQRLNLDTEEPSVQRFVAELSLHPEGLELELHGRVVCQVVRPAQLSVAEREELMDKVAAQLTRAHQRNRMVPARVIKRAVRKAVAEVRCKGTA